MSCSICNTNNCGCIPKGLTTPNLCPNDTPVCPDPIPCDETTDANCVIYTGPPITGTTGNIIPTNTPISNGLQNIVNYINYNIVNNCCNFVEVTNAQLLALISAGTLDPGTFYKVTNVINADQGVIVHGIVGTNSPSLQGSGIFLNADYQAVGVYTGVAGFTGNIGIWSSIVQPVTIGKVVIWNNKHWKNLTGNWGSAPDTDSTNWLLLAKSTTNGYIREVDFIKYNPTTNLVIYRADKRLNEVEYYDYFGTIEAINVFQWGRDVVTNNKVLSNSYMQCTNSHCVFSSNLVTQNSWIINNSNSVCSSTPISNNTITNGSRLECNISYDGFTNNSLSDNSKIIININSNGVSYNSLTSNSRIDIDFINQAGILYNSITNLGSISSLTGNTPSVSIFNCSINGCNIQPIYFTSDQIAKIANFGYSNFYIRLGLTDPAVYNIGTQTLTIPHEQFGLIELVNTNSYIISKIDNISDKRNTRFTIYNNTLIDTYVTFQHTVIASANSGKLVCDAPSSANTLVGRYFGSDFIEYQKSYANGAGNYVNLRTNLVKLA